MAASASSLFSPLYLPTPRFSFIPPHPHHLYSLSSPLLKRLHPLSLLLTKHHSPLRASPSDQSDPGPDTDTDPGPGPDTDTDIEFIDDPYDLFNYDAKSDDPPPPEGMDEPPPFFDAPLESEEDITRAYEELYGPAYSGESVLGNDVYDEGESQEPGGWEDEEEDDEGEKIEDEFEERVVQVRTVTQVVKGGRKLNFRVVVIVGDFQGHVGVGVGKAEEILKAVKKSTIDARRNVIKIPLTKYSTFPHRYYYYCGYS